MVTPIGLPLLIVNGKFQSLGSMSVEDLETFIPFLVKCSVNRAGAQLINGVPEWWTSTIQYKFPLKKPNGLSQTGYHRHLLSIVCSCYWYHDAQYLLPFCAKIANSPETIFLKNNEDNTTSIFYVHNATQVMKFNNENKNYDNKKKKLFRQRLLSALLKKPGIIPDIYLCENCDNEFISHSEMQKHEEECYKIVTDKKSKISSNSSVSRKRKDDSFEEADVIENINKNLDPSYRKNIFLNYLKLESKSNEGIERVSKLKNRVDSDCQQWTNGVLCLLKDKNIEFSSMLGRKLLEQTPKQELKNKIERDLMINEYYCRASCSSRPNREQRDLMDFKVTCKKPKRNTWTHLYSFSRKERRSRYKTLKTGLNESSRKLLKQCKELQIVLDRLSVVS